MTNYTRPMPSETSKKTNLLHPQYFPGKSAVDLAGIAAINGFELLNISEQPDSRLTAVHCKHTKSGLLFVSIHADDNHHFFDLSLPTLPTDSSGLPHILEHSVLSGSAKFPSGDPFSEMTRSLILSETNASTARDHTRYYVSSTDQFSFFSAASIFIDALFHSSLTQEVFHRERGHLRRRISGKGPEWEFDGVVYNEMAAQVINAEYSKMMARNAALYPGTAYALSSGGDPIAMLSLTYERFIESYKEWYRAERVVAVMYGNTPLEERLAFMNKELHGLTALGLPTSFPTELPLPEPSDLIIPYIAPASGDLSTLCATELHWRTKFPTDFQERNELSFLAWILSSAEYSPIVRALREQGIHGRYQGLSLSELGNEGTLSMTVVGISKEQHSVVRQILLNTLRSLVTSGISRELIETELIQWIYSHQEGLLSAERGSSYVASARHQALRGRLAIDTSSVEDRIACMREKLDSNVPLFENLLSRYLLENPHCISILFYPDPLAGQRIVEERERAVAAASAALTDSETTMLADVSSKRSSHATKQATGEVPVATIRPEHFSIIPIETHVSTVNSVTLYHHDVNAMRALVRIRLHFPLSWRHLRLLPEVYSALALITGHGPSAYTHGAFDAAIQRCSRGISISLESYIPHRSARPEYEVPESFLTLSAVCRATDASAFLTLLADALNAPYLDRQKEIDGYLGSVISSISSRARRPNQIFSTVLDKLRGSRSMERAARSNYLDDPFLAAARQMRSISEKEFPTLRRTFEAHAQDLLGTEGTLMSIVASEESWNVVRQDVERFLHTLPQTPQRTSDDKPLSLYPKNEAFVLEGGVNYTGFAIPFQFAGPDLDGRFDVVNKLLSRFIEREVRQRGGAYGGVAYASRALGAFIFGSFRDPNLLRTLSSFRVAGKFLRDEISESFLERAKVSAMADLLEPVSPAVEGIRAFNRLRTGLTLEDRIQFRRAIADTTIGDVRTIGETLDTAAESETSHATVYGARVKIEEAIAAGYQFSVKEL